MRISASINFSSRARSPRDPGLAYASIVKNDAVIFHLPCRASGIPIRSISRLVHSMSRTRGVHKCGVIARRDGSSVGVRETFIHQHNEQ